MSAASTSSRGCRSGAPGASRSCSSTASWPGPGSGSGISAISRDAAGRATPSTCATTTGRRRPIPPTLSFDTYTEDVVAALDRLGPTTVVIGHGMGGLLSMKAAERVAIGGLVLIGSVLPRDLRVPARAFDLREIPEAYGKSVIGWETLPERLLRDERDLTLADVLRIQHLLGQKPHEAGAARRQMLSGVPVDRRVLAEVPRLVIGGGLDRSVTLDESERLAEWLGAEYEPFGAHSHYGMIVGEDSHQQVAEAIRAFLDTNRL
ncbi:MAG: alpha/beta hydrolase [Candidatus Limnocylindrales bacterium]